MSTLDAVEELAAPEVPQRASAAPLLLTAAMLIAALARRRMLQAWLRGYFSTSSECRFESDVVGQISLPRLGASIIGQSKAALVAALGLPRAVSVDESRIAVRGNAGAGGFWRAKWWYYAVGSGASTMMAIRFVAGVAKQVDFIARPQKVAE